MNKLARFRWLLIVLLCVGLVAGTAAAAPAPPPRPGTASPPPPYTPAGETPAYRSSPALPLRPSGSARADLVLGAPGTSYRYVQTFGVTSEPYPADLTHLYAPAGVWVGAQDVLYIAESEGYRMLSFDQTGAPGLAIGVAGLPWSHESYLANPRDVVTLANGHILVLISTAVKEFDDLGNLVQTLPYDDPWNGGSDDTHFNNPMGLAINSLGQLFVGDSDNHRVQVYDIDSLTGAITYNATIGVTGAPQADNTGFNWPTRLAFDSLDRLYVLDTQNYRIQRCTHTTVWSCSTFFGETGVPGSDLAHLDYALGLAIRDDDIYIADSANRRVLECTTAAVCELFAGETGVWGVDNTHFSFPNDLAVDSSANVWVSDSDLHRVQKYSSAGAYLETRGQTLVPYLADAQRINHPAGVAIASDGGLIVVEGAGSRLLKFSPAGVQQWAVGQTGLAVSDNTGFCAWAEGDPAVDAAGRIYVTDTYNNRVQVYNSNGTYFATLGQSQNPGLGNDQFGCPIGAAVSPLNGDILIADACNHRLQVFDSSRVYKATLGEPGVSGADDAHFNFPRGVAVDAAGVIYVADNGNNRVQKCTLTGTTYTCALFAGVTGVAGAETGYMSPVSVEVDRDGRVFVSDHSNARVDVFAPGGAYLTTIGGYWDSRSSAFASALGLTVDKRGDLYVADAWNHRIQKFTFGTPGWRQVNLNGFGDRFVDQLASMEVFANKLYIGTSDYSHGVHNIFSTLNGKDWHRGAQDFMSGVSVLRSFNGNLYAGTWAGLLWSSPDGDNWTNVFTSPNGFGSLSAYNGALYLGTYTDAAVEGTTIYKSTDGLNWTPFVTNGNGDQRASGVVSAATYKGLHYFGIGDWGGEVGGRIWRTDGTTLTEVVGDGFGDPANYAPGGLAVFGDWLYASVNSDTSEQVWRSNSGDPGTWSKVLEVGLGEPGNKGHTGLIVYGGQLFFSGYNDWSGMQVWRTRDGVHWVQVGYAGFGDSGNERTEWGNGLAVFNDRLYFGTVNYPSGAEVWVWLPSLYLPRVDK